jgi:geranylgeranylglycerol-phosphate geranylgeranyltransferase
LNFILGFIKLLRPLNIAVAASAVLVSAFILGVYEQDYILTCAVIVVIAYNGAANAFNDYCDYEIDLINRPNRPLSRGIITSSQALSFAVILFTIGSITAFQLPFYAMLTAVGIAMPLMIIYSLRLKGTPLLGNVAVAMILGLTFVFCGLAFNKIGPMVIPAILAFGLTFVRELIKDIADVEGDNSAGLKTLPLVIGKNKAITVAVINAVIIGLAALLPYFFHIYGKIYLILLVIGVEIPLTMIVVLFVKSPSISTARQSAKLLKFSTIVGLTAILVDHYAS